MTQTQTQATRLAETALAVAEETWRELVPRMAARGRMRVSRDGGRNYRRRDERPVTDRLPNQPAAVLVYDQDGCAPVFCVDLDTAKGPPGAVERDFRAVRAILRRVGITSWFSDVSPNGGRHVYVPLAVPVPFSEARSVALALAAQVPTMDPLPMLGLTDGCIRPPGARHRSAGHQVLVDDVDEPAAAIVRARDALARPASPEAWARLVDELEAKAKSPPAPPARPQEPSPGTAAPDATLGRLEPLRGYSEPDAAFQRMARTGEYDPARYATPSEARQGVVWSAVASGWSFTDLVRRLEDGTWRGLASFYARYPREHRRAAIARDWHSAMDLEKRRRLARREESVRLRTTSRNKTHGGVPVCPEPAGPAGGPLARRALQTEVRQWLAAVDLLHPGERTLAERFVLKALAEAVILKGSLTVEFGNRSLAIATGLDQSTVGRILRRLLQEPRDRALIDLVRPARRLRAAAYQLVIPDLLRPACEAKPWRRGRVHAVRLAFRELGLAAAEIYEVLEQLDADDAGPVGGRTVADRARLGHDTTYLALNALASWGLATRVAPANGRPGGWALGSANLNTLAEAWGVVDQVLDQMARYRLERADWLAWLTGRGLVIGIDTHPRYQSEPEPPLEDGHPGPDWWLPAPDPDSTSDTRGLGDLLALLRDQLGARVIA